MSTRPPPRHPGAPGASRPLMVVAVFVGLAAITAAVVGVGGGNAAPRAHDAAALPGALPGVPLPPATDTTGTVVAGHGPAPELTWERRFPGVTFRESSPVDARLGRPAVVVGALNGDVYALDASTGAGLPGWPVATGHPVNSSPAAADLYGTGQDEVVVGSGWADGGVCAGGAVFALDPSGAVRWERAGTDPGCATLAFHSSPALGDVTGSGTPDVTIGALGLRSWSWSAQGTLNPGWPLYTDDTVFATPALADVNHDGVPDVVMGGDSSPGGLINWRGGIVRAVRGDGRVLWQFLTNEMVRSSPVVGPVGASPAPSIVFGTGDYWVNQPGGASDAHKVFSLSLDGRLQWAADLGAETIASPALADVEGDGRRDIVIGTANGPGAGRVWALNDKGVPLPHWAGVLSGGGVVIGGVSTADLNGDGAQDVLVPTGAGVFAYDGRTADRLFSLDAEEVGFQSTPLVTTDANGLIGITVAGTTADGMGVVQHFEMPPAAGARLGALGWPTFHHDERRTGNVAPPPLRAPQCQGAGISGYWEAAADGGVFASCGAGFHGSPAASRPASVVAIASSPSGHGYWEAAADGGVFAFGDATFAGSAANAALRSPIVGIARTPDGRGYWLAAADGGVFAFGDAPFEGGAGAVKLPFHIVTILPTPSGLGYWLIGDQGSVLTYGDAGFYGAANGVHLSSPIVAAAATPSGQGYWLVAADGGVFTYGDARFLGSTGTVHLHAPIVAIAPTAAGRGYWLVAADGGVFTYG
ncbi:MAG TPA: FG-GAP-like repeat-containing protein, partial [Acidimicrobiales bacterium]